MQDCVDMDCDGPKHSIIRDLDGHFVGTSHPGSLIPRAELRFDSSRVPYSLVAVRNPSPMPANRGIARGLAGYDSGCLACAGEMSSELCFSVNEMLDIS